MAALSRANRGVSCAFLLDLVFCAVAAVVIGIYSVSNPPPLKFSEFSDIFFLNGWEEFLVHILHACYTLLSTLEHNFYSFISNCDEVMPY